LAQTTRCQRGKSSSNNGMHHNVRAPDVHIIDVSECVKQITLRRRSADRCHGFIAVRISACRHRPAA
jgi:hypothetical protein